MKNKKLSPKATASHLNVSSSLKKCKPTNVAAAGLPCIKKFLTKYF